MKKVKKIKRKLLDAAYNTRNKVNKRKPLSKKQIKKNRLLAEMPFSPEQLPKEWGGRGTDFTGEGIFELDLQSQLNEIQANKWRPSLEEHDGKTVTLPQECEEVVNKYLEEQGEPALDIKVDWPETDDEIEEALQADFGASKDRLGFKVWIVIGLFVIVAELAFLAGVVTFKHSGPIKTETLYRNPQQIYELRANPFETNKIPLTPQQIEIIEGR